jgi:uncharacterized DUF497 family protein
LLSRRIGTASAQDSSVRIDLMTPDYDLFACAYNAHMSNIKTFNWSSEKNQLLMRERGISFERIVFEISCGNEVAVLEHPNQEKYPGQRISMVPVDDYVYAVPFIETETEIFLRTIIPSRKATRQDRSNE